MNKTIIREGKINLGKWFIIDATDKNLGRLASETAKTLVGKYDPLYAPNVNPKNIIVIINADKIRVTGNKKFDKFYYRHSGQVGGLTIETFNELQSRLPGRILEKAVKGILPKGPLGRELFNNLKVYAGSSHPHEAQNPVALVM
ncbi:ribosomal protein L13 (chloroplast) [Guillardia theta]|uniref:Large ribosomal subunit protein uL13c n=2 Tax=Guillardia theta TaxID=55529 RepID=RK13_GUITH|nr:ribosomal protein L13 [Guillardia theta]O46915.1 RecName: Full=Large ribosomal subunit protein uL13c; AltName: Full=50S ribosomal protein L13, chloroplastic [Guillardia theta]AAC35725.1 ribosomal protein L13 [Guillardia theta]